MELELTAGGDAAVLLTRLKGLAATREGRSRGTAVKMIWHDSPDRALFGDGLCLVEQRGLWRLERVMPGPQIWLPGQAAPVLAEGQDPTALPGVPETLAPIAAFEGRRTATVHRFGEHAVTLMVTKGVLRAVTAERPVLRLSLSGEDAAVREAALLIAETVPVGVPAACLAAEAVGLASGHAPAPRHAGAPKLPAAVTGVAAALAYIIGHLTDVVLAQASRATGPDGIEAVHQMRVAVRRARSALSVFRDAVPAGSLDVVREALKELASDLGATRDWDVFVTETLPSIAVMFPGDVRLDRLTAAAEKRRAAARKALVAYLGSPVFRRLQIELAWFVAATGWQVTQPDAPGLEAFSAAVLRHRLKKLTAGGKRIATLDIPALHGVRIRAKQTRYAAEIFSTLYAGKAADRFIHRLAALQERLGVLNDGAVATHLMAELGGPSGRHGYAVGLVEGFMAARAMKIRPRIIRAFERFRRQPVYWA